MFINNIGRVGNIGKTRVGSSSSGPVITLQPTNAVVAISSAAVFTVDYTGTEPITGQWEEYK